MREVLLVAAKDLRIELRSRVLLFQVAPFAVATLVLLGFALDADRSALRSFSPGLFWVAVLLTALLAAQRSVAVEHAGRAADALLLSATSPARIFAGKALALAAQLAALELLLGVAMVVLYDARVEHFGLAVASAAAATVGIAAAGTLYGVLAAPMGVRETLLPALLLPVFAPVLIGATRAFGDALGTAAVNGWAWFGLLGLFALVYAVFGALAYGPLLEAEA